MLFKSPVFAQASGSIAGQTFSRNRGGMYTRARALPTNPQSARQVAVRSAMADCVNYWRNTLTAAQRAAWETYGENVPVTNRVGDSIYLTGQQWFTRSTVPRLQAGLPAVVAAPTIFDTGTPVSALRGGQNEEPNEIEITGASVDAIFSVGMQASDDGDLLIYVGRPVNPTVNYFKGPYQLAGTLEVADAAAEATWGATVASLTIAEPLAIGQIRPLRVRVAYDDGRLSAPWNGLALITAGP